MNKLNKAIAKIDAALCKRRPSNDPSELSPISGWGKNAIGNQSAITELKFVAQRIESLAKGLRMQSVSLELPEEGLQAAQLRRTASQIEALAARIRREAGTAAWPNWWAPTVDLTDARPVLTQ